MTIADNLRHASNNIPELRAYCRQHAVRKQYHVAEESVEYRFGDGSGIHFFASGSFTQCEIPRPIATEFV